MINNKKTGLRKLPFYVGRLIFIGLALAVIFLLFIYQQWQFISRYEAKVRHHHLPSISTAHHLQHELSNLNIHKANDKLDLHSLYSVEDYKVNMNLQTQFSYKRKVISSLAANMAELQDLHEAEFFMSPYIRFEQAIKKLLVILKQNETAKYIHSKTINSVLDKAIVSLEQLRRLHEREAKRAEKIEHLANQSLIWSGSMLAITLFLMWSFIIFRTSRVIAQTIAKQQLAEQKVIKNQQLLDSILNHASACVCLKDINGKYLFINQQFESIFNVRREELIGKTDYAIHSKEVADTLNIKDKAVLESLKAIEYEEVFMQGDILHTYIVTKFPIFDQLGQVYAVCEMASDISQRKEIEMNLRKLNLAVEHSPNLILITNPDGEIEYANCKVTEITGFSPEEVIGKTPRIFKSEATPPSIHKELWDTISNGNEWRETIQNKKKNGDLYWARESIAPVFNDNKEITHFVSVQEDVSVAKLLTEKLSYQANHDVLTELINRQAFERRLERIIETSIEKGSEHVLCYMDLDQFKIVNDSCGHAAGDELLRQLSKQLLQNVRHRDTLARLGGDEFAILMEHCSILEAEKVAKKILAAVAQFLFAWKNKTFRVGISIGLVTISKQNSDITELLKQADLACYAAKDAGRNRVRIFHPDDVLIQKSHGEMDWVHKINDALEHNRFVLFAQKIIPLQPQLTCHYEILLRMMGDNGEVIKPGAFLPTGERYHLSQKIDRWVIHNVFSWIQDNHSILKQNMLFTVNLSGQNLGDELLLEFIFNEFLSTGLDFQKICFEITETAAIHNLSTASNFISQLKRAGCKFSIDDFGSGLSSFEYLKKLPVDFLKIDGIFVKNITNDAVDLALIKSINEIGHIMGKQTIAEFVENQDILNELKKIGVDYAQGYHLSIPKPLSEFFK